MSINKINGSVSDTLSKVNGANDALLSNMLVSSVHNANTPLFDSYSVDFNGSSNYAEVDGAAGDINGAVGTISAWVKLETTSAGCIVLRTQVDGTTNNYIAMWYHASNNQMYMTHKGGGTSTHAVISSGDTIENSGSVHHLVGTWSESADEVKIYLDSELKATTNSLGTYSGTNSICDIGQNTQSANFWNGLINEVGVWDAVLDADAITAIYNDGKNINLTRDVGSYDNAGDLVGYWKFEEGTGTSVADSSTNSNTATLSHSSIFSTTT